MQLGFLEVLCIALLSCKCPHWLGNFNATLAQEGLGLCETFKLLSAVDPGREWTL